MKIELPPELATQIADKIAVEVKQAYYWEAAKAVSAEIQKKLVEDGFVERVATAVVEKVKIDESEYTKNITAKIQDHLLNVVGVIANETLDKVTEKVKSYGFIKIG